MARPFKEGLEYFALDCTFDTKVELLIAEFGSKAVGVYISLLQQIYKKGYYCDWNDDEMMLFARKVNEQYETIAQIVDKCFDRDLFDHQLFKKYGILTSTGIQKQFISSSKKRKEITIYKEYCLLRKSQLPALIEIISKVNDNNNRVNGDNNEVNDGNKYTKEKEIEKEKEIDKEITESGNPHLKYAQSIIDYLNQKSGKDFRLTGEGKSFLMARIKDGYTDEDFHKAIDYQVASCLGNEKESYLSPKTIFRPDNFERYRNSTIPQKPNPQPGYLEISAQEPAKYPDRR